MAQKITAILEVKDKGSVEIKQFGKTVKKEFDKSAKSVDKFKRSTDSATKSLESSIKQLALLTAATAGVTKLAKSFITTARETENFKVRLKVLLGSVEESNRLFKSMNEYASQVPFTFQDIMTSATQLAGVLGGSVNEVNKWIPLIGDLAAATGLSIRQTTEQVSRMLSAGAASADLFRERGVLAMLGFTAGVSYSVEETRRKLFEAWNSSTSMFKGATQEMANTWDGLMSMISDQWTKIMQNIADAGVFDALKDSLRVILELTGNVAVESEKAGSGFEKVAESIRAVNSFVRENKELLSGIIEILSLIAIVWIGGKILSALKLVIAAVSKLSLGFRTIFLFFKSIPKEITAIHRGTLTIGTVLINWKTLLSHIMTYFKLIRLSVYYLVYKLLAELVSTMLEAKKVTGDYFDVWDIGVRKIGSLWEHVRHLFSVGLINLLKGIEQTLDILLYKPLEAFIQKLINDLNYVISLLNKLPGVSIDQVGEYRQSTLADYTQADKLIEAEAKRHAEALKQIQEDYLQSPTGRLSQVRGVARSIVGDIRGKTDGTDNGGGGGDVNPQVLEKQKDAIRKMQEEISRIKNDARTHDLEMLKQWYEEQKALLQGHTEGMLTLEEAYRMKRMEIIGSHASLEQEEHTKALEESLKANEEWAEQAIKIQEDYQEMYETVTEKIKTSDMDKYEKAIYLAKKEYQEKIKLLKKWLDAAAISNKEYVDMSKKLYEQLAKDLKAIDDERIEDMTKKWKEAGKAIDETMSQSLADVLTGTKSWSDAMMEILNQVIAKLIELGTQQLMISAGMSAPSGGDSGGGLFGGLFGAVGGAVGGLFGGGDMWMGSDGMLGLGFKHGGITPKIPGAADGNVFNGPTSGYPVMMHGNEAVIPLKSGKVPVQLQGSGGNTNNFSIVVNNNNSGKGDGMSEQDSMKQAKDIKRQMELMVKEVIRNERRPGGQLNSPNLRTA